MKAKTKIQKHIMGLSKTLPKPTRLQRLDAFSMHKKYGTATYKRFSHCLHCGHQWKGDNTQFRETLKTTCPKCKEKLTFIENKNLHTFFYISGHSFTDYYAIVTVVGGYQVTRLFESTITLNKGYESRHYFFEVAQHYMNDQGKVLSIFAQTYNNMGIAKSFSHDGILEFRGTLPSYHTFRGYDWRFINPSKVWRERKFLPILRRNGIKSSVHGCDPAVLFTNLIRNQKVETLFKARQYGLAQRIMYDRVHNLDDLWPSMRILMRNDYRLNWKQAEVWIDLVNTLDDLGHDILNPANICPERLTESHDHHVYILNRRRSKKRAEEERKRLQEKRRVEAMTPAQRKRYKAKKEQEKVAEQARIRAEQTMKYQAEKGALLDLVFTEGDLVIEPLKTVEEFYTHGETMHHCVGSYFKKKHSLVLSAKMKDKIVETIELSLKDYKILQVRGVCNQPSGFNDNVRELVTKNMSKIKKMKVA